MSRMRQVTFSSWGQVTCKTMHWHKYKQQWREKRAAGNIVIILSYWKNTHTYTQMLDQGPNLAWHSLRIVTGPGHTEPSSSVVKLHQCVNSFSKPTLQIQKRYDGTHNDVDICVFFSNVFTLVSTCQSKHVLADCFLFANPPLGHVHLSSRKPPGNQSVAWWIIIHTLWRVYLCSLS